MLINKTKRRIVHPFKGKTDTTVVYIIQQKLSALTVVVLQLDIKNALIVGHWQSGSNVHLVAILFD